MELPEGGAGKTGSGAAARPIGSPLPVYLSRWPQVTGKAGPRFWVVEFGGTTTSNVRWPRVVAIVMACINVLAEMTCLIVLFLRSSGTFTSVIVWLGLGFSMA